MNFNEGYIDSTLETINTVAAGHQTFKILCLRVAIETKNVKIQISNVSEFEIRAPNKKY